MKTTLDQADYQLKRNNIRLATQLYRELTQVDPANAEAHLGLAKCLLVSKRYNQAFDESLQALKLDPSLSIPHRILANVYWQRRQLDLYEEELNIVIQKDPNSADMYIALGKLYANTKRIKESASVFQTASRLDPNNWIAHYYLSAAYLRLSQKEEAYRELAKAYSLKQSFATGFAFVSAFMSLNRVWLFPLVLVIFLLSLLLPAQLSLPLFLIIAGLQLASGLAYFQLNDIRNTFLSLLLFLTYTISWIYIKL